MALLRFCLRERRASSIPDTQIPFDGSGLFRHEDVPEFQRVVYLLRGVLFPGELTRRLHPGIPLAISRMIIVPKPQGIPELARPIVQRAARRQQQDKNDCFLRRHHVSAGPITGSSALGNGLSKRLMEHQPGGGNCRRAPDEHRASIPAKIAETEKIHSQ